MSTGRLARADSPHRDDHEQESRSKVSRVIVVGAGIVGLTTALMLSSKASPSRSSTATAFDFLSPMPRSVRDRARRAGDEQFVTVTARNRSWSTRWQPAPAVSTSAPA
jgi:hypothetical protein